MKFNRSILLIVMLLAGMVIVSGLPVPLIANAAKYAQVSREIMWNQEWINLSIGGDAYDQKPPLLFWLGALSFTIFGFSILAYKLAVLVVSFAGIFATYKLGKLLYDKNTGFIAAVFWFTSLCYLHFHNDIHTDTLLGTIVVVSVWQLTAFLRYKKWHQFLFGIVGVGLAMLTKGPVGLAVPVFAIGTDLLWKGKYSEIFHWRWLIAIPVVALIILPALLGLMNQFGADGIKFYFWTNNMGRITGTYYGGNNDPFFYIHTSLYLLIPWSVFSFAGIVLEIRELIMSKGKSGREGSLVVLGAIIPYLLILSIAKTKNPHYLLAVAPFMMIVGARWALLVFEHNLFPRLKGVLTGINRGVVVLLWLIIMVPPLLLFPEKRFSYWVVMVFLLVFSSWFFSRKSTLMSQLFMLAFCGSAFLFMVSVNMLPNMLKFQSSFDAVEYFNKESDNNSAINIYGTKARLWDLFLYSKKPGKYLVTGDDLKKFLPQPGAWIYTDDAGYNEMKAMGIEMDLLKSYKHKTLTKQSLKFLNPETREAHFEKMYLVRLK